MSWEEVKSVIMPTRPAGKIVWKRCRRCGVVGTVPAEQTVCDYARWREVCGGVLVKHAWTENLAPRDGRGEPIPLALPEEVKS